MQDERRTLLLQSPCVAKHSVRKPYAASQSDSRRDRSLSATRRAASPDRSQQDKILDKSPRNLISSAYQHSLIHSAETPSTFPNNLQRECRTISISPLLERSKGYGQSRLSCNDLSWPRPQRSHGDSSMRLMTRVLSVV